MPRNLANSLMKLMDGYLRRTEPHGLQYVHILIAFCTQALPREGERDFTEPYSLKLPLLTPKLIQFEFRRGNQNFVGAE